jgi:hypothetical protein
MTTTQIMSEAHGFARILRGAYATYAQALRAGLRYAWQRAKAAILRTSAPFLGVDGQWRTTEYVEAPAVQFAPHEQRWIDACTQQAIHQLGSAALSRRIPA